MILYLNHIGFPEESQDVYFTKMKLILWNLRQEQKYVFCEIDITGMKERRRLDIAARCFYNQIHKSE